MAHLYRLGAWLLLAATLAMLWTPAQAAFAPFPQIVSYRVGQDGNPPYYPSPVAACNAIAAGQGATYFGTITSTFEFPHPTQAAAGCLISNHEGPKSNHGIYYNLGPASCPANSTLSGGQCTCNASYIQNATNNGCINPTEADDQKCDDAALLDSTAFGSRDIQVPGKVSSGQVCLPTAGVSAGRGCKVNFSRSASYQKANGDWLSEGTYQRPTGQGSCEMATAPVPAEPDTCKNGQPGQINGVTVCVPFSNHTPTVTDKKTTESTTTPAGTETKDSTSQTECKDGKCTTTTTVNTTINGTTTTTTNVTTSSKGDHCKAAAGSPECSDGSSFSGDCDAGFTFEGDAIQGAMAKEIHTQNCLLNRPTEESSLYDQEKNKTGNQTTNLPGNDTVTVGANSFDQSNALPVGPACIGNKSVTVMGTTVNLPFSGICPWLENLGYVLMAISALLSARIVTRG